jgi:hypothetical protein
MLKVAPLPLDHHRVGYSFVVAAGVGAIVGMCRDAWIEATMCISRAHDRMGSVRLTLMGMVRDGKAMGARASGD